MPWSFAFLAALAAAVAFGNLMYRQGGSRADRVIWSCLFSLAIFGQGLVVGWNVKPDGTEPDETRPIATERIGMESNSTLPNGTPRLARERERAERNETVRNEIGPPPHPEAVAVLGYTTAAGVTYPSRWRMPPNADTSDNLKAE